MDKKFVRNLHFVRKAQLKKHKEELKAKRLAKLAPKEAPKETPKEAPKETKWKQTKNLRAFPHLSI